MTALSLSMPWVFRHSSLPGLCRVPDWRQLLSLREETFSELGFDGRADTVRYSSEAVLVGAGLGLAAGARLLVGWISKMPAEIATPTSHAATAGAQKAMLHSRRRHAHAPCPNAKAQLHSLSTRWWQKQMCYGCMIVQGCSILAMTTMQRLVKR